jgi:hypothetical protein
VIAGSAVISPVLNLLAKAYGFAGAANVGVVAQNPLPAPQATLISALAQGVIGGSLNWTMIGIGALVGVALILLDAALGAAGKLRVPPLAVGIGIYLPMSATFAVVLGAIVATWYEGVARRSKDYARADRLGTLVASGLIVGESLFGVLNAALIVGLNSDAPIALGNRGFRARPHPRPARVRGNGRVAVLVARESGEPRLTADRRQKNPANITARGTAFSGDGHSIRHGFRLPTHSIDARRGDGVATIGSLPP